MRNPDLRCGSCQSPKLPLEVVAAHLLALRPANGFVTLSAFSCVNVAGNRRHAVVDAAVQVRNEPARSSLKCGRRSR